MANANANDAVLDEFKNLFSTLVHKSDKQENGEN